MTTFLIGIDDTDNKTSLGTGRLARMLSEQCANQGFNPLGITRHQFMLDPKIPYTSHNSGACIAIESEDGFTFRDFVFDFITGNSADGSDPGVCIADVAKVSADVVKFANSATQRIVTMQEAFSIAKRSSITLHGLGGTCQGIIGALGSVGLRASGENGRFIDLPGLRELSGCVGLEAFDKIGIKVEQRGSERSLGAGDRYETLDWVRPRLIGGKAILPVQWSEKEYAWIPVDKKGHTTN